jgi:transposase
MSAAAHRWTERLARFATAGQTIAAFCAAEGVSEPSFYAWKRKLAARPATSLPLVPIHITPSLTVADLELVMPSGSRLRLPADYPPERLAALLRGLEDRPC